MGATLCIICAICYAIVIIFGYIKRKMAKSVAEGEVKSGFSAGEVAYKILQSYSFKSKATIDDELADTEEKNEQDEVAQAAEDAGFSGLLLRQPDRQLRRQDRGGR